MLKSLTDILWFPLNIHQSLRRKFNPYARSLSVFISPTSKACKKQNVTKKNRYRTHSNWIVVTCLQTLQLMR